MSKLHSGMFSASIWGIVAKIIDAVAKFVTIPMLVGYYGKGDYGLIALAFSLNAYLRLMDIGLNVGSIRFFSMWISQKEWEKIQNVSQSSIVFYGVIGIVNALAFFIMSIYAGEYFNLTLEQLPVFRFMMYVLAASAVVNWTANVVTQLLSAHGEIAFVNRISVISSAFNFISAFIAIKYNLSLPVYFALYILSTVITIPLNVYKLKVYKMPIMSFLYPKWNGKAFKEILSYSVGIFAMGIFQFTANNLRPLLLGIYSSKGIEVLTEYRVIQTITMLVIAFGGVFVQVLLPYSTKIYTDKDESKVNELVFQGTKYISVFLSIIVFCLVANARPLIILYMGQSYSELTIWLQIWLITVLLAMHNAPVATLVLASGKTKSLVYMSAVSCLISIPITAIFASSLNVGAAVVGYFVYVVLQIAFYYIHYTQKVLKIKATKLFFGAFVPALFIGIVSWLIAYQVTAFLNLKSQIILLVYNTIIFTTIFCVLILSFVIRPNELRILKTKIFKR